MAIKYPQPRCVRQKLLLTADGQVSPGAMTKARCRDEEDHKTSS